MIDQTLAPHIDPDTFAGLVDLQAQIKAIVIPAPTDLTEVNKAIADLTARTLKLEGAASAPTPVNRPPVWTVVPPIIFSQGKAGTFSIAPYVTDPDNDPLSITKNVAALPQGVSYNQALKAFVYDGVGPLAPASQHFLIADDGRP
jgi:hypothetical protein